MKNANIEKINKLGMIGKILSVILIVISTIALVMSIISGIAMATLSDDFMKVDGKWSCKTVTDLSSPLVKADDLMVNNGDNIEILGLKIKTFQNDVKDSNNENMLTSETETTIEGNAGRTLKVISIFVIVLVSIFLILLIIVLRFAKALCKALEKCDSPFEENVVKKMRNFAISLIPWGVFCVSGGGVSAIGIAFIVIIVCLFSAIFRHGAKLQQESDETL